MYQNINKIYHAAIYVRLSKEDGDISSSAKLESNSISNQKALILDFLKDKKDIEVVSVRVDDGYSGSNFDRPAFQAMLEDIRRGIVDCVVVKDLSRFGREYIDSGKYIERLFPALGVRFIAMTFLLRSGVLFERPCQKEQQRKKSSLEKRKIYKCLGTVWLQKVRRRPSSADR